MTDPSCGPYDRGTTTKVELGPGKKPLMDGSPRVLILELDARTAMKDAMLQTAFGKGEQPPNAEQKELTRRSIMPF